MFPCNTGLSWDMAVPDPCSKAVTAVKKLFAVSSQIASCFGVCPAILEEGVAEHEIGPSASSSKTHARSFELPPGLCLIPKPSAMLRWSDEGG